MTSNFIPNNLPTATSGCWLCHPARAVAVLSRLQRRPARHNVYVAFSVYDQEPIWWARRRRRCADGRGCGITRCPDCSSGASDDGQMNRKQESRLVRGTVLTVLALTVLVAKLKPPPDSDYLRMKLITGCGRMHLAGGYYDHPPMVAVVIRLER